MARVKNIANYNSEFAKRLRKLIKKKNTTITAVANVVGVTRQAFSSYQDGSTQPTAETIVKIAKYFNVSTDYLLGLSDVPTTDKDIQFIGDYIGFNDLTVIKKLNKLKHNVKDNMVNDFICDLIRSLIIVDEEILGYVLAKENVFKLYENLCSSKLEYTAEDKKEYYQKESDAAEAFLYFQVMQSRLFETIYRFINDDKSHKVITRLNSHFDYFGINKYLDNWEEVK